MSGTILIAGLVGFVVVYAAYAALRLAGAL